MIALSVVVCCCKESASETSPAQTTESNPSNEDAPKEFLAFIEKYNADLPADVQETTRQAASAEIAVDHLGAGRALRNGELNRWDSGVRQLLVRKGLYHPDDMSGIVLLSAARRLRGERTGFEDQVTHYREYWEATDCVAPTDIRCPQCKAEMKITPAGCPPEPGWDRSKYYFGGECPSGNLFWYYHKDGWRTTEQIEATFGEQATPSDGDNPSN